ncbi:MAG TPA: hypothetical protein VNU92_13145 [Edaphobacter sp.]|nr:hypothetical protein [Edaphobacter sp.]
MLFAQDTPAEADKTVETLHVYTDLIQIPTLVLGPTHQLIKQPIPEGKFSVSIDGGPTFRATHTRLEGDDPLSISILLDVSGDTLLLLPKIDEAIARLAPNSLHAKDRVSIYALDCSLVQSLDDVPVEREKLRVGVRRVLESWQNRQADKRGTTCKHSVPLWDAIGYVAKQLSQLPGRRVILAVSQGEDSGSEHSLNEVRTYLQATGVAVFGVFTVPLFAPDGNHIFLRWDTENAFRSLCELSGGIVFMTRAQTAKETLNGVVTTLRGRYIVEFPRPAKSTAGFHSLQVTVADGRDDFITSSGITVPLPDAAALADPTTVPSDPAHTPQEGNRRLMRRQ